MAHYADTSALVKLVVAEAESEAVRAWISATSPTLVSCDLARTELLRAVRHCAPDLAVRSRQVLDSITILSLTTTTFEAAVRLDPTFLGSLDAIHIASALELGDDLAGIVTYDDRMAHAAQARGVAVVTPR